MPMPGEWVADKDNRMGIFMSDGIQKQGFVIEDLSRDRHSQDSAGKTRFILETSETLPGIVELDFNAGRVHAAYLIEPVVFPPDVFDTKGAHCFFSSSEGPGIRSLITKRGLCLLSR